MFVFFTLIKEIDITLRLNLKKKRPRNWESYTFSLLLKYILIYWKHVLLFVFITIKKNPTVFARNEDLFVVVHTFETHLYLISEVTTACFSTSLLVIHEQGSHHSRRGTSDKQRRRSNTRLSYIVLLYCDFFAFQSAMTPTPLKKKLDFWYMMLNFPRFFVFESFIKFTSLLMNTGTLYKSVHQFHI